MTLPEVLTAIRRSLWLVALVVLVCVSASGLIIKSQTAEYQATSKVLVTPPTAATAVDNIAYAQQIVGTYAQLATTPFILDAVAKQLGLDDTGGALASDVTATTADSQLVISITADAGSGQQAAALANAVASQLKLRVQNLTQTTRTTAAPVTLTIVQSAVAPARPFRPAVSATLLAGLVAGLVLGVAAAVVRARLDTRVRDPKALEAAFDRPVIGVLPGAGRTTDPIVTRGAPAGPAAEAYRTLRTNLEFLNADEDVDSIVITSALPGEGKSTCVLNLGVVMAKAGKRVLLVEADLRKPRIAAYAGIDGGVGLTDVLIGRTDLAQAVQEWGPAGLSVLPAGSTPPNPSELLHSNSMRDLAQRVRDEYDLVLFDSPPLSVVTDASILARLTSGAVVTCALGRTKGPQAEAALDALRKAQAPVLGFVATFAKVRGNAKVAYADPTPRAPQGSGPQKGRAAKSKKGKAGSPVFVSHRW